MQMKEYRISDLFEKVEVQKIQGKANDFPTKKDDIHTIPLLTSTGSNQGFSRYAAKEDCPTILQDVISIASNGDAGATFYQAEPFAVLQDAYAIQLKAHKMTETIGLYLAAAIRKAIYDTHDWVNKAGWNNIKDSIITLPSVTHIVPDWAIMAQIGGGGGEMNNFDTSTWKEFKIGDVFDIRSSNGIFHANALNISEQPFEGSHPYVVRSSKNNGIRGYIKEDEVALNPAKTISFAQDTAEMFYQKEQYFTGNKVKVISIKNDVEMSENIALFMIAIMKKAFVKFQWGSSFDTKLLNDVIIALPVTEINEPDWDYMQERIAELEQERIAELEQYLIATGLNDYELTDEDKQILATKLTDGGASQSSESGGGCWKEARKFKLVDIANVSYGTKFDKNKMSHACPEINFVSRTAINNGVSDCVDECGIKPFATGTITLALGGSIGSCFIQERPYYTGQNVGVIELPTYVTDKAKVYFVGALQKECKAQFTAFANEINRYLKTTLSVLLPTTSNGQPDWDFMDKYIHAIEKAVIADVVKYKDEIIMNTKTIA